MTRFFILLFSVLLFTTAFFGPASFGSLAQALEPRAKIEKEIRDESARAAKAKQALKAEAPAPTPKGGFLPLNAPGYGETAKGFSQVCDGFLVDNPDALKFGTMERRLVCGDESGGQIGHPWADIPPNEKAYFLKGFLQTRGFHHPEFFQDGDYLYVKLGAISTLRSLKLLGGPEGWQPPERRLVMGTPLTPALLNDTQSWALGLIKDEGYACAEDSIQADPDTGEAAVFFKTGPVKRILELEQVGDSGVNEGALNRYNAFVIGERYQDRMVALTRRRTLDDGFLQTLVMTTKCDPGDKVTIIRDVSLGPPRTIRIGVGGSTEEGPLVKAVVRQARIGSSASSAQLQLSASYLRDTVNYQSIRGNFKWYYLKGENRYSLDPTVQVLHDAKPTYDLRSTTISALHDWTFDTTLGHYDLRAGPAFINEDQTRSKNDHYINAGYVEVGGRWTDHDFEWFNTSPRTGEYIDLTALLSMQHLGSEFTAQKLQVQGEKLWSIGYYDPPLLVVGVRFNVSGVLTPNNSPNGLPTRFLTFLGGDADLRGYTLQSLPRSGIGALSGASGSFEARLHDVLFKVVDIFGFLDSGILGQANFQFQSPIFMSPGFGFRWESPFGVLRTYLARRFTLEQPANEEPYDRAFRFGVTFGEEF